MIRHTEPEVMFYWLIQHLTAAAAAVTAESLETQFGCNLLIFKLSAAERLYYRLPNECY